MANNSEFDPAYDVAPPPSYNNDPNNPTGEGAGLVPFEEEAENPAFGLNLNTDYSTEKGRLGYSDYANTYDETLNWYFPADMEGDDSKAKWMTDAIDAQSAYLMRDAWADNKDMFYPVLGELQNRLSDENRDRVVDVAGNRGLASGLQSQQMAKRDLSRFGVDLSKSGKQQFDTGMQHNMRLNELSGRNLARQQMHDAQIGLREGMAFDIGQGVQSQGLSTLVGANNMTMNRMSNAYGAYSAANQAQSSQGSQFAGSIIGGLAMGAMMV